MQIFGVNVEMDRLAMPSSVYCYGHALRRKNCLMPLEFEVRHQLEIEAEKKM